MRYLKLIIIIPLLIIIFIPKNTKYIQNSSDYLPKISNINHIDLLDNNIFNDDNIGYIKINKIHLNKKLYSINNKKNNVEENVTILKDSTYPNNKDSTLILAAHSGTGRKAYFNNLDKLKKNDLIDIELNNKKYTYIVKDIWETKKNGSITFPKMNKKQLILTTCSKRKNNYQLVINCIIKE